MAFILISSNKFKEIPLEIRNNIESFSVQLGSVFARLKAQEEIIENEKKFRDLAELLPQPIYETDINGFLTYTNQTAINLFGYDFNDSFNSIHVLDLVKEEDKVKAKANFTKIINGINHKPVSYELLKKNGEKIPFVVYVNSIKDSNGKIKGTRCVAIDLSDLKRADRQDRTC